MMQRRRIADMPNLGPSWARRLVEIDDATEAALPAPGAVSAYARLKFAFPRRVGRPLLNTFEGA